MPGVTRRDVKLPRFPSNDFEVGAFVGTYSTQNFGASTVGGLRLGYNHTKRNQQTDERNRKSGH